MEIPVVFNLAINFFIGGSMKNLLLLLVTFGVISATSASYGEDRFTAFINASRVCTKDWRKKVDVDESDTKRVLAFAKRGAINPRLSETVKSKKGFVFPSKEEKEKTIKNIEESLEEYEKIKELVDAKLLYRAAQMPHDFGVGDIGVIHFGIKLIQRIDDGIARVEIGKQTVFLSGIDFSNLADGDRFSCKEVLEVTGTKQYQTVLGAGRTEYILEPFKLAKDADFLERFYDESK